jgi:hypothetical protein
MKVPIHVGGFKRTENKGTSVSDIAQIRKTEAQLVYTISKGVVRAGRAF